MSAVLETGAQTPRILHLPDYHSSAGVEACELAALAGLELDPWEAFVLEHSLGEGVDGRWAAAEVGLCVPRQNGKDTILEARELAGLFLLEEELLIHSAQQFKTAKEHFLRLLALIESTPELERRVRRVVRTHGEEGIELLGGQRILFLARTKSAGRGFSAPFVAFNEAMFLAESSLGALLPTQAAKANRQRWYVGSAVDQLVHPDGLVFARVRQRAIDATDPRLAYFEWSVASERPEALQQEDLSDEQGWMLSNPGLGLRIMREAVEDELRTLDWRTFAVERLGVGDWPDPSGAGELMIEPERWAALVDESSSIIDPVCFAFDVAPDRSRAAIAAAGPRSDGLLHLEVVKHEPGTGWVVEELARLYERWQPARVVCDAAGPVASLITGCEEAGIRVEAVSATEHARACGFLVDAVANGQLRHLGSAELAASLRGATRRRLGDAWAWSRRTSAVDISPLVAATLALWAANALPAEASEIRIY